MLMWHYTIDVTMYYASQGTWTPNNSTCNPPWVPPAPHPPSMLECSRLPNASLYDTVPRHSVNSMALMGCPLNNGTPSGSPRVGSKLLTSFCADERNHNDVTGRSASAVQAGGIQGQASSNVGSVSSNSSTSSNSSSGSLHLLLIKDFLKMLKQMDLNFFSIHVTISYTGLR